MEKLEKEYQIRSLKSTSDLEKWGEFVFENNGGFFQSKVYYDFCRKLDGYIPVVITANNTSTILGSVLAIVQSTGTGFKKYFSRRAIIIGGPIIGIEIKDKSIVSEILDKLNREINKRAVYTEFRNLSDLSGYTEIFAKHGYLYEDHYNVQLRLTSIEDINKDISGSKKRQIKKTIKNGATIVQPENMEQVRSFYLILRELYKTKVKKPLPSWRFFEELYHLSLNSEYIKFFLIVYNSEVVGGILSPIFNGTIYEWYIANKEVDKNLYPGVLATWAPIEYGISYGLNQFDFLGAGKPGMDYGVRDFKLKFGGTLVKNGRYTRINQSILYSLGKLAIRLLAKL